MDMVMRFGTWNVRNLLQVGNMNMIADEVERYKMDVVASQEIRWKVKGSIRKVKFTLRYSGNERQGNRGVGLIVSKKVLRICTLQIKDKLHNITFVNVYAPTEDTEDERVDEFYETLQFLCD
jgi:exonuclease III